MLMHEITQALHKQRNDSYYSSGFEYVDTSAKRSDTRRPRLTLLHLQRLRKKSDEAEYERQRHLEMLPDMYSVVKVNGKWKSVRTNPTHQLYVRSDSGRH